MNMINAQTGDWPGMRPIRILSAAEAIYGNRERALTWLRTDTGSRIVTELLIQIDEGTFV